MHNFPQSDSPGESVSAIESEPQHFAACADWPVHFKPDAKPKKPAKSVKPDSDPAPIFTSVPVAVVTPVVVMELDPPVPRRWASYMRRACWLLLRRFWRFLGTVCHEIAVKVCVAIGITALGALGLWVVLARVGVKDIDYEKPPEPKPPVTADESNGHWRTTVTPEPKSPKHK